MQLSEMTTKTLKKEYLTRSYKKLEVEDYLEAVRFVLQKNPEDISNSELKQLQNPLFTVVWLKSGFNVQDTVDLVEKIDEAIQTRIKPRRH